MIKLKKLFFIIFLINYFCLIDSNVYVKDVTIRKNEYYKYSDDGSDCELFSFLYLISDSGDFTFESNEDSLNPYVSINPVLTNDTAKIFKIEIREIPIAVYTHNFIVSGSSTYYFDIHYECAVFPIDEFEIKDISVRGMELDINGRVSAVFKYDNLKADFNTEIGCYYCYITKLSKNYYLYILDFNFIIPGDLNKTLSITYNDIIKSVSFKSYYDPTAYTLQPLFTYYSNNTKYYKPIHTLAGYENYRIRSGFFVSRPISSKDGKVKYIGLVDTSVDTFTFLFLSQNLENLYPVFTHKYIVGDPLFQPSPVNFDHILDSQSITVHFEFSSSQYDFYPFQVEYFNSVLMKFPFGYKSGNLYNYKFNVSLFLEESDLATDIKLKYFRWNYNPFAFLSVSFHLPVDEFSYENVQYIHLYDDIFILRIEGLSKSNPIYKWTRRLPDTKQYFYLDGLVSGSIMNPTYDFHVSMYDTYDEIGPNEGESNSLIINQYYDIKNIKYFAHPSFNDEGFDYFAITYAKMLYSEIDVTNKTAGNILYFNISNINQNTPVSLVLYDPIRQGYGLQNKDFWPATWNSYLELFQIEFFVKANSHPGKIPYSLFFDKQNNVPSSSLPDDALFTIISKNEDLYGPIIDNFNRFPNELQGFFNTNLMSDKVATWTFNIIDEINGFRDGYIVIMGNLDGSKYNFSLSPYIGDGDKYNASYSISINLGTVCASQTYIIVEVLLFDEQGNNSTFSLLNPFQSYDDSLSNPFINYLYTEDQFYNNMVVCEDIDDSPPVLLNFELVNAPDETNPIDVGSLNRMLNFKISANDTESGLKLDKQSPIIYLSTSNLRTHECYSDRFVIQDDLTVTFIYKCQIPLGFGYPHGILFSIYNFINQGGTFGGYSNYDLKHSSFVSGLAKESIVYSLNHPIISGGSRVSADGGDLWIYGRGFANVSSVYLRVEPILNKNRQLRAPWLIPLAIKKNLFSALHISGIPKGTDKFNLVFDYLDIKEYQDPFVFIPSEKVVVFQEDLPVNPNQECLGTPQCGGSSRGYCSNTGCICYSPYVGKECLDTVIIIPESPLSSNRTDPITQLKTDLFKSLISLVSIREIDIYDKVVFEHKFEKWTLNQLSNDTNDYQTTVGKSTLVKVRLQWFSKETIIKFADQQINMNPSSVKYSIEIVDYPFASKLNYLELVIKASLETLDSTCSAQEFGYTSGDNMEYMKIQIDDHSLYGRFIRRGIFDELKQVKAITNRIIPDNSISNSNSFSSTLIGIKMAYFSKRAIIDPDFSVLLDSNRVDKKSNSICSNKGSNKLSGSKIAGIVIGCVAFVAIVIVCIIYNHQRKKKQKKFVANMQQKLKQIN
ncbi:hypothetical protein DICPUDRAFT_147248 [Dictyostelium purpureum]|uniref:EGF-like domain-containing protein n=1 Tax=Dictyostelium purpureum TaxID=5786 RepID=F0Z810_DICPU|nr:uncharacterized protein DICPUDRAFT_147248 [Dictyostelium purpureum]EGC39938.1 hypothetical protein DICPUDRAFT_147248 [Dictyostelium purpureum]|eukprot:XP_003283567.1 hypothetical protein DICPUDRAFT_147248 [Dictyostelium purpureum]